MNKVFLQNPNKRPPGLDMQLQVITLLSIPHTIRICKRHLCTCTVDSIIISKVNVLFTTCFGINIDNPNIIQSSISTRAAMLPTQVLEFCNFDILDSHDQRKDSG